MIQKYDPTKVAVQENSDLLTKQQPADKDKKVTDVRKSNDIIPAKENTKETATMPSLSGVWSYSGGRGESIISHFGNSVIMEWTFKPRANSLKPPHYKVETTVAGSELKGRWSFYALLDKNVVAMNGIH